MKYVVTSHYGEPRPKIPNDPRPANIPPIHFGPDRVYNDGRIIWEASGKVVVSKKGIAFVYDETGKLVQVKDGVIVVDCPSIKEYHVYQHIKDDELPTVGTQVQANQPGPHHKSHVHFERHKNLGAWKGIWHGQANGWVIDPRKEEEMTEQEYKARFEKDLLVLLEDLVFESAKTLWNKEKSPAEKKQQTNDVWGNVGGDHKAFFRHFIAADRDELLKRTRAVDADRLAESKLLTKQAFESVGRL